uniref:BHLH domain-containing protein n=3 Tax=Ciona intestinalis TaxID=7719 RepID=H2XM01_CIOIN
MEKVRRKRINNSLDKLRTLLPHSVNIKKDMASLLEQTVEYINIMHTVLNEDKPACLNKVYIAYRQKTEEIENFRKSLKKTISSNTSAKRSKSSEPGCSWGHSFSNYTPQPSSSNSDVDPLLKHSCMAPSYYDALSARMGNHPWSHQKTIQDSMFASQPSFSGQSQSGQLISIPMQTTASTSRSIYYPPAANVPVKQFDGNFTFSHVSENGEITEQQKPNGVTNVKSETWQPVLQSNEVLTSKASSSTAVDLVMGSGKLIAPNNQ